MLNQFADVVLKKFDVSKISATDNVLSKLFYPKLILISGKRHVTVLDVELKAENKIDYYHETELDIIDVFLHAHLLWIMFDSAQVVVFDVIKLIKIQIVFDGLYSCNFKTFKTDGRSLYLTSDSEECFIIPNTVPEVLNKFDDSTQQINIKLEKTQNRIALHPQNFYDCLKPEDNATGLQLEIDRGALIAKCPITGLRAVAASGGTLDWKYVLPWGEIAVLSDDRSIWIVGLQNAHIHLVLKAETAAYIPLALHKDSFYYLVSEQNEVYIRHINKVSSIEHEELPQDTVLHNQTIQVQSGLKKELHTLIHSITSNGLQLSDMIVQLQQLFDKIDDLSCLLVEGTTLCHYDIQGKIFLLSILKKAQEDNAMTKSICEVIFKIEILEYLNNIGNNSYDKLFILQSNFVNLCITFISDADVDLASIAWLKYVQIKNNMTPENIVALLDATPHNIKWNAFILWLKNFIPPLLDENPFYIDLFVKWTTDRVFLLEKSGSWPKIGIKFIEEILLVLESAQNKFVTIRPTSMDGLDTLKVHIAKIFNLKEKYRINMLLGELSCLSPTEIVLIMLQRCYTEDLEAFLHDYLSTLATETSLDFDNILKTHVERETSDNGGCVDEARLHIFLGAFHTNTTKLECLLDVLRLLDVPWSTAMLGLATTCVNMKDNDFVMCDSDLQLIHQIKMELNFANLNVVLKKYNFPLNCNDYLLVLHKIVSASSVDLNDLNIVMKSMSGYSNYGSVLYIDRCLKDYLVKKALDYYKTLSKIEQKIILKSFITKFDYVINDSDTDPEVERSYLDFIKGSHAIDKVTMSKIEDMYHLKNSYNIKIDLNDMSCEKVRQRTVSEWFSQSGEGASTSRGACVTRLARLPQTFLSTLVDLLSQTSANAEVLHLVESLVTFTKNELSFDEIDSLMANFKDTANLFTAQNCCLVLVDLITKCPENYLHLLVGVLSILNAVVNTSITDKHVTIAWKFHYVFVPMSNISSTENLLKVYVDILSHKRFDDKLMDGININDFVPFRILSMFAHTYISSNVYPDNIFIENKEKFAKKIISNILQSQENDELLLASSLLLLTSTFECEHNRGKPEELLRTFEGYGAIIPAAISQYLSSTMMCHALALENVKHRNITSNAPHIILKAKYNLNFADMALPDITEDTWDAKIFLYYVLQNYPNTTTQRLVDFCHTLNVDVDYGLSLQLISFLVGWELKYKLSFDDFDCSRIKCENDENDLITNCAIIWDSIRKKDFLVDILKDFWKKGEVLLHGRLVSINPYYYEIYLCIFKLIGSNANDLINANKYSLLQYLKDYKRTSSPKQYEYELFSVKGIFPEIGYHRLPFQLFMKDDMWSNLKSEITLATYEKWLPIAPLLCLDSDLQIACDMLCSNALKQTMTARKKNHEVKNSEKHNDPWGLVAMEEPLLRAAHRCVRHIANMEWAAACLFYVLQGCARGADQVAAAHLCYNFAQRWATLQPANRAVCQMQKLHSTLSTRHALHKIYWACDDLLKFSTEPPQLIRAIYFHPDFITKMMQYDVNKTVDEIADKNNINISSIRIQILENILEQNSNDKIHKIYLNNEDLMRAKCILKATCPKMGAMYLARIALEDETDFNKSKKLRALQCLISIVEPDTALKVTNQDRVSLWHNLIDLFFSIRLENVDMPWAVATFTKDKARTLEQVCTASENGVESLQLAAELSLRYGCERNTQMLISRLVKHTLFDILSVLLCKTFIYPDVLVSNAWSAVLLSPFIEGDHPITERQRQNCIKAINLLPLCPCISDKILNEIWNNCTRIKCYAIACLTIPFMSDFSGQFLSDVKKIEKRKLVAGIKNLQADTYVANGALAVLDSIFSRKQRF